MAKKRAHVVKRDSGWAVRKEGNTKASKVYRTKEEAIRSTEKLRQEGSEVVVHKGDGSIQDWKKSKK